MSRKVIKGIKLITLNTSNVNNPDDASMPFKMTFRARVSGMMMDFTVSLLYGDHELVVVRGETLEAIEELIEVNDLRKHPRFKDLEIIGPDGFQIKFERRDDIGDHLKLEDWQQMARQKLLSSDSGHGVLATYGLKSNRQIRPSQVEDPLPKWATHVIWYGK